MEINAVCAKRINRVIVKRVGVVSTVTVRATIMENLRLLTVFQVCQNDDACISFPLAGIPQTLGDGTSSAANMTCYKGGETVFNNHQMCNVTSVYPYFPLLEYSNPLTQIERFSTCYRTGRHKLPSAVTARIVHVHSSSGLRRSSHSTAHWTIAIRNISPATTQTLPFMPVRK